MNTLQLFRLISLYHIRRNKLRNLFVVLIVAVGTLLMYVAVDVRVRTDAAREQGGNLMTGTVHLDIRSGEGLVNTDLLEVVQSAAGVQTAVPLLINGALVLDRGDLIGLWGIDPQIDREIREYVLQEGEFISDSGSVLMVASYAVDRDYQVGDSIRLVSAGGIYNYTIGGLLAREGIGTLNGGDMLIMHYADVQQLTRSSGLTSIGVVAAPNVSDAELQSALEANLPETIAVTNPAMQYEKTLVDYIVDLLTLFTNTMPALLGSLMITSTLSSSIAARRKEIAILRSLGLTQRGIQQIFLFESAIIGMIGALLGILLSGMVAELDAATTVIDGVQAFGKLTTPLWIPPLIFVLGTGIAVLASWFPIKRVVEIDPTEAMRQPDSFAETKRFRWLRFPVALICFGCAWGIRTAVDNTPAVPFAVISGIVFTLTGIVLIYAPIMIWLSQRSSGIFRRIFGFGGVLAGENLSKRHRRAIAAGLLVLICVWFWVLGVTLDNGSALYVRAVIENEILWDLTISGPGQTALNPIGSLDTEMIEKIMQRPDIASITRERLITVPYAGTDYTLRALDIAEFRAVGGRFIWENGDETTAYTQLQSANQNVLLTGGFEALNAGIRQPGRTVTLNTPKGEVNFEVIGSIHLPTATFIMDYAQYSHLFNDIRVDRLLVNLKPGTDIIAVRRELMQQFGLQGVYVIDREELRTGIAGMLGKIGVGESGNRFVAVFLMPFMIVGIANMLFIAILDRRREIGMLRAVGVLRRQIIMSVMLEAVLLTAAGCILAVPAVFFTVYTMLFDRITGVTINPHLPSLLPTLAAVLLVAALSAYLPARRAARLDILDALRYE